MKIKNKQRLPEAVKNEANKMLKSKKKFKGYSMSDRHGYSYELIKSGNKLTIDIFNDSYQLINTIEM